MKKFVQHVLDGKQYISAFQHHTGKNVGHAKAQELNPIQLNNDTNMTTNQFPEIPPIPPIPKMPPINKKYAPSNDDTQIAAGCIGLVLGFIVCGLTGFALGLLFLDPAKAVGLGILSSILGATTLSILLYKLTE